MGELFDFPSPRFSPGIHVASRLFIELLVHCAWVKILLPPFDSCWVRINSCVFNLSLPRINFTVCMKSQNTVENFQGESSWLVEDFVYCKQESESTLPGIPRGPDSPRLSPVAETKKQEPTRETVPVYEVASRRRKWYRNGERRTSHAGSNIILPRCYGVNNYFWMRET